MRRGPMTNNHGHPYTVVFCPGGEFREGAQFVRQSFEDTLKMGFWPAGMVVERDGHKYRVESVLSEMHRYENYR